eukprot:SAG11_NODE_15798_length_566_cov_0.817987_2_plen_66_part_01
MGGRRRQNFRRVEIRCNFLHTVASDKVNAVDVWEVRHAQSRGHHNIATMQCAGTCCHRQSWSFLCL